MSKPRKITLIFLGCFLGGMLFQLSFNRYFQPFFQADYWRTIGRIGEVLRIVHVSYVEEEKADLEELSDGALSGMLQSLDRYSNYLPPGQYENYRKSSRMEYEGVGVEVQAIQDRIVIVQVFDGGSAKEQGLLPGDQIVAVDDEDVTGLTLGETVARIKGAPKSEVTMLVERPYPKVEEKKFQVIRRSVLVPSVSNVQMLGDSVGYVQVSRFTEDTHGQLRLALDQLQAKEARFLVIDLRGNPGGLLTASVELASEFLKDGERVVSVKGRDEKKEELLYALEDGRNWKMPIAVLIDHNSASASEILAGALKAHGLATIVGEPSVGKGTVQTVYNLKSDAGMVLTTAKYYLPDGTTIAGKGVTPDIVVEMPPEERSRSRLSLLHRTSLSTEIFEKTFGFLPQQDPQLESALDALLNKKPAVAHTPDTNGEPALTP
jgi:carboxyl-terminal processing protease